MLKCYNKSHESARFEIPYKRKWIGADKDFSTVRRQYLP